MWFLIIIGFFFRVYLQYYHFSVVAVLLYKVLLMSLGFNKWRLHLKPSMFCLCLCFKFNPTPSHIEPAVYWMLATEMTNLFANTTLVLTCWASEPFSVLGVTTFTACVLSCVLRIISSFFLWLSCITVLVSFLPQLESFFFSC